MAEELGSMFHNSNSDHQLFAQFSTACRAAKRWASASVFLFCSILLVGSFIFMIDILEIRNKFLMSESKAKNSIGFPLKCFNETMAKTCKVNYPAAFEPHHQLSDEACPHYFRWIHEDLQPWKSTGIWRETLEKGKDLANFRLVILNGKIYVEKYKKKVFQTRDMFTIWGFLQLLRLYPGRVPDLELMFVCGDMPVIHKRDYQGPNATLPPVLFQYSGHDSALAVVFPDWSFWGWAELNIKPWKRMLKGIRKGSKKKKWRKRVPYAYWKGNPTVSPYRRDLMKCNVSHNQDWNARLYAQDWGKEVKQGFKNSNLEDQCNHRYKIYVEGRAWSVSGKYILACDATALVTEPEYYDFFMRSLVPMQHYWPISKKNICKDIKFAVDWGNKHPLQAEAIGKGGSTFIKENVEMKYVYAYMFHLLKVYAKLLKFKPEIPQGAKEVCPESMVCFENGIRRKFMEESVVTSPSDKLPCNMPPSDPLALKSFLKKKKNITTQVMMLGKEYWESINKRH